MGKGGGGGGGGSAPNYGTPPEIDFPEIDVERLMSPLVAALTALTGTTANVPEITPPPATTPETQVNWMEKQKEVMALATQNVKAELAKKQGRASTLLTNPLNKAKATTTQAPGVTR
jgi:hypothetical protein